MRTFAPKKGKMSSHSIRTKSCKSGLSRYDRIGIFFGGSTCTPFTIEFVVRRRLTRSSGLVLEATVLTVLLASTLAIEWAVRIR